ncbi:MAG: SRPBCC family protein [Gemmatimonadaceae bacterium]
MPHSIEVTTPNDREIRVTRAFDAPRNLVFDCHTQPELVRRWLLGPPGWSMPVCEIDLRVGGKYAYVWRSDAGKGEFGMDGEYHEVVAPARVVNVERFQGGEALCTLTLEEVDGRTLLTQTMVFGTRAERDGALQTGMTDGMRVSYDRMESLLKAQRVA